MTINDATPYPMEDPEQLGLAFGEVFDLVDETIDGVTDAEIEQRLRQLLADTATPGETVELSTLDRVLRGPGWSVSHRLDPKTLGGMTSPAAWEEAHCALQAVQGELAVARAAADAARRDAAEQRAAADAARRQAEEVTAGVNAYVDEALDRAENVLAEARAEAARIVTEAEQQAQELLAAARTRADSAEMKPAMQAWSKGRCLVVNGSVGSGKTAIFAAWIEALLGEPAAFLEPQMLARAGGPFTYPRLQQLLAQLPRIEALDPLMPSSAVYQNVVSGCTVRSELTQHVGRLFTASAGSASSLTGSSLEGRQNMQAVGGSPANHPGDALWKTRDGLVPQFTGSCTRWVHLYDASPEDLHMDLCVVLGSSTAPLAPADGPREADEQSERLGAMVASPGTCPGPSAFDEDSNGQGRLTGAVDISRPRSAQHYVLEAKDYHAGNGRHWLQTTNPPLMVLWTCSSSENPPQPALRELDSDALPNSDQQRLAPAALAGEDGASTKK